MFIKYKFPYKTYLGLVAFFILINLLMGSSGATIVDALVLCVWSVMGIVSGMEIYKFYKEGIPSDHIELHLGWFFEVITLLCMSSSIVSIYSNHGILFGSLLLLCAILYYGRILIVYMALKQREV